MIAMAITAKNVIIKGIFNTRFRITASGRLKPITDIMKARAVPTDAPFSINVPTIGTIPAAFEYRGMPMSTAAGTDHHAFSPKRVF